MNRFKNIESKRSVILLDFLQEKKKLFEAILKESNGLEWEVFHKNVFYRRLPTDISIQGIITESGLGHGLADQLLDQNIPMVRVGNTAYEKSDKVIPAIIEDLESYGRFAADYFAKKNFKICAFVGNKEWSHAINCYKGFYKNAIAKGMQCHLLQLDLGRDENQIKHEAFGDLINHVGSWLKKLPRPIPLLAPQQTHAIRLSFICRESGLRVPEDVAILSLEGEPNLNEYATVPISTITPSDHIVGAQAVKLLDQLLKGGLKPTTPIFIEPREIVERRSTDILAISNVSVVRAIRIIWDNLDKDLNAESIAKEIGVSARSLQREFSRHLGRGINAEMRRKRLETIAEQLKKNEKNIEALATKTGFTAMNHFRKSFKKAYGLSPKEYREKYR